MATTKTRKKKFPKRGYFFWRYDLFPYYLGGEGTLQPAGRDGCGPVVVIDSMPGMAFHPVFAFKDISVGQRFHERLSTLESDRATALDSVNKTYTAALNTLLAEVAIIV